MTTTCPGLSRDSTQTRNQTCNLLIKYSIPTTVPSCHIYLYYILTNKINNIHCYCASYASTVCAVIECFSICASVRPSVCPSVTSRSCTKMAKPRSTQTTPYDSPETLVSWYQNSRRHSNDITPMGAPNKGVVGSNRRFSTNISLYLKNGAR